MADQKITISTEFLASIKGMGNVVNEIKKGLGSVDISKNGLNAEKLFKDFQKQYDDIQRLTKNGDISLVDSSKLIRESKRLADIVDQIKEKVGSLDNATPDLIKKLFPNEFSGKVKEATKAIKDYEDSVKKVNKAEMNLSNANAVLNNKKSNWDIERGKLDNLKEDLNKYGSEIERLSAGQGLKALEQQLQDSKDSLNILRGELKDFFNLKSTSRDSILQGFGNSIKKAQDELEKRKKIDFIPQKDLDDLNKRLNESSKKIEEVTQKIKSYQSIINGRSKASDDTLINSKKLGINQSKSDWQSDLDGLKQQKKELEDIIKDLKEQLAIKQKLLASKGKQPPEVLTEEAYNQNVAEGQALVDDLNKRQAAFLALANSVDETEEAINQYKQTEKSVSEAEKQEGKTRRSYNEQKQQVEQLTKALENLKNTSTNSEKTLELLEKLGYSAKENETTAESIARIKQELANADSSKVTELIEKLKSMGLSSQQAEKAIKSLTERTEEFGEASEEAKRINDDISSIKNRVEQFLRLDNALRLVKRSIKSAFNTIKELDATMSSIAVVTDLSVGDMWAQLPQYTARANELGVATNSVYEAAKLYYQQGLKTNEVTALTNETLKMARIAGIDAAEATDSMTAALRGFNMEIDKDSAQRINDTYSKLASITASDTEEISTAMTKVASLAHNANMEFESTAAFLAQIVETTRESAETAGTALKTVIARFSEVKKLYTSGDLIGSDEEGEEIDVNKVSTALRGAGVNLNEYLSGAKGLDDIFMELAKKWDSLDQVQQRYIATMAAGSRQQSRFIALMSDYKRTTELVNAANNSAGASNAQFAKTVESLESKLNLLKNAWDEFTMGLADNSLVKTVITVLTEMLDLINKITSAFGETGGSIAKIALAAGAFKVGRAVFNKLSTDIISTFTQTGQKSGDAFSENFIDKIKPKRIAKSFKDMNGNGKGGSKDFINNFKSKKFGKELSKNLGGNLQQALGKMEFELPKSVLDRLKNSIKDQIGSFELEGEIDLTGIENANDLTSLNSGLEAVRGQLRGTGHELQVTDSIVQSFTSQSTVGFEQMQTSMRTVGSVTGALAMGVSLLGSVFGEKAEPAVEAITTGLGLLSVALMVIPPLCKAVGIAVENIPIIGWIAAIMSFIFTLVSIIGSYSTSEEKKLEDLENSAASAKEAAQAAKQAYEDLLKADEEYNSLQDTMDKLIVGTNVWKKTLIEANQEVLNLLATYPELAKYITNKNGRLIIKEEGFSKIQETQFNNIKNAEAAMIGAQAMAEAQRRVVFRNQLDDYVGTLYESAWKNGLDVEDLNWEESNLQNTMATILSKSEGAENYDEIVSLVQEISSILGNIQDSQFTSDAELTSLLTANSDLSKYDFADSLTNFYGKYVKNKFNDEIQDEAQILKSGKNGFDIDGVHYENDLSGYQKAYAKKTGIAVDDIPENLKNNEEALTQALVSMDISKNYTESMEKLAEALSKAGEKGQKLILAAFTGDLSDLTGSEIAEVSKMNFGYIQQEYGISANDLEKYFKFDTVSKEDYIEWIEKSGINNKEMTADKIRKKLEEDLKIDTNDARILANSLNNIIVNNTDSSKLSDQLADTMKEEGSQFNTNISRYLYSKRLDSSVAAAEEYRTGLKSQLSGLLDSDSTLISNAKNSTLEGFVRQEAQRHFNKDGAKYFKLMEKAGLKDGGAYLSTIDWTSPLQAVEALQYLYEQLDPARAEELWNAAISGAGTFSLTVAQATKMVSRMQTKIGSIEQTSSNLKEGKGTEVDFQSFLKAGVNASDFTLTSEGWKLTEDKIKDATKALKEYYVLEAKKELEAYEDQKRRNEEYLANQKTYINQNKDGTYSLDYKFVESINDETFYKVLGSNLGLQRLEDETTEDFKARVIQAVQDAIDAINAGENDQTAIVLQAQLDFVESEQYDSGQEALLSGSDKALDTMISQTEDLDGVLQQVTKNFEKVSDAPDDFRKVLKALVIDVDKTNAAIDELNKTVSDSEEALSSPDSEGYQKAISKIAKNASKIWGDGLSDDEMVQFVSEHTDLFLKLIEGGKEAETAFANISQYIAAQVLDNLAQMYGWTDGYKNSILNIVSQLDNADFSIDGTADFSQIFNQLAALMGSAEEAAQYIRSLGYTVDWEIAGYEESEIILPDILSLRQGKTGTNRGIVKEKILLPKYRSVVRRNNAGGSLGYDGGSSVHSGGGSSSNDKSWENPYDYLYNLTEKINAKMRERQKLERNYNKMIESRKATGDQLLENSKKELKNLQEQQKLQEQMLSGRNAQMEKFLKENSSMSKYATYDFETQTIKIDWDLIDSVTDTEEGEKITDYISGLELLRDEIQEAEDSLDDIEDQVYEIKQRGKDEYGSLEDRIKEALINSRQKEIDKLSAINDSINDTNSKVIAAMQEELEKTRQERENEKTEEEISDKQRRLAYLQQDTSGANALEILQLQKEINDAQESYTDQLIDQKINELQKQNDKAAEQREQQIAIMEAQLEHDQLYGRISAETAVYMKDLMESGGVVIDNTPLAELLKSSDEFQSLTNFARAEWWSDLQIESALATQYYQTMLGEYKKDFNTEIRKAVAAGNYKEAAELEKQRNEKIDLFGLPYEKTYSYATGDWSPWEGKKTGNSSSSSSSSNSNSNSSSNSSSSNTAPTVTQKDKEKVAAAIWTNALGWGTGETRQQRLEEVFGKNNGIQAMVDNGVGKNDTSNDVRDYSYEKMRKKFKGYKTGGLANYTGLAWLDGTPSKPEIVLNQRDSKNFIQLRDILAEFMKGSGFGTSQNLGANYFDVDINVESISDNYDVEQIANKIKDLIRQDALYRNVNVVGNMR